MGKHATKAGENIFTQARYNAAKFNDRLNSREGASEELGIDFFVNGKPDLQKELTI